MLHLVEAILDGAVTALGSSGRAPPAKPATGSWFGLPVGILCTAGAAGAFYAMFYQGGDLWQIAKLLLLMLLLGLCALGGFYAFAEKRRSRRRQRRIARGQCPRCGYDLRGAPSANCPECGNKLLQPSATIKEPALDGAIKRPDK